ncbi:MAG: hypothetical protein R8M45_10410 [Ghiorsea sp.]
MNKKLFWGILLGAAIFATLAATRSFWMNVNDFTFLRAYIPKVNILPVEKMSSYDQACASCHMLYAPSMLPARSWKKMMDNLENHFGDNAEVSPQDQQTISAYLQRNAADHVENTYAQSMLNLLDKDATPLRTSDTPYFKLLHDVVKDEMVLGNPQVLSWARCDICHHEAVKGRFNKFDIHLPNYRLEGIWKKGEVNTSNTRNPS